MSTPCEQQFPPKEILPMQPHGPCHVNGQQPLKTVHTFKKKNVKVYLWGTFVEPTSGDYHGKSPAVVPCGMGFLQGSSLMSSELMRDESHLASEGFREENIEQKH